MMKENEIKTPFYIVYEDRLRANLELISRVARQADVKIIMAFKANALWRTFPIIREYGVDATASSLNELRLAREELHAEVHSYCPAYTPDTIGEYLDGSTHITFNSLGQWERFRSEVAARNGKVSPGLRVNPQCSVIGTDIYNPALPGSRFGVTSDMMPEELPQGLEGFHFHALCESDSHDLERVLAAFEEQFGRYLPSLKWVNMGGGHLMTRAGYDTAHLVSVLRGFKARHPNLEVILEPGSAFTWRTGDLITSVVDVVENQGVKTAIVDVSFACHMPDTLEMPYKPAITEALAEPDPSMPTYRLGGNSCLSGDYVGDWSFVRPLQAGDRLRLEDMNHYTTVKTTMFNGISHPSIVLCRASGECEVLREFTYQDYRMS
ncbi:carboxynorspermidine decarboxylase [Muribaculum intestinale]|uniref:carboxynorspermidine decarboxylase n=1 Tax=Muribaculum intestinale TaxID=1796646 RepID=UPI0026E0AA41|nr:carboxynorspermidine decarboxylase [Muribaculum intestinale]